MAFAAHIAIAKRYGKPLVIHDRDAHRRVLEVLDAEGAPDTVILHCFSGDEAFAVECVRRGYLLSFAGTVTFANAGHLRAAAAVTPPEQMLVETDAPFLAPVPYRGKRCEPAYVKELSELVAQVKGCSLEELSRATCETAQGFFRNL